MTMHRDTDTDTGVDQHGDPIGPDDLDTWTTPDEPAADTTGEDVEAGYATAAAPDGEGGYATAAAPDGDDDGDSELFVPEDRDGFERRWSEVQGEFVDDPRAAVESADRLVAEVMQSLSSRFGARKDTLEQQWATGGRADTEQLRQALTQYRTFFHRLLAA